MAKLFILALCLLAVAATFASAVPTSAPSAPQAVNATRALLPEAKIVDYDGMSSSEAVEIRAELVKYLDMNLDNNQLTNYMWDVMRRRDPNSNHLVTISKCTDYCFEGTSPSYFVIIEIDRASNRFMVVGRNKC